MPAATNNKPSLPGFAQIESHTSGEPSGHHRKALHLMLIKNYHTSALASFSSFKDHLTRSFLNED